MKKSVFVVLVLLNFAFAKDAATEINVTKTSWQEINKKAIAKLILQQKKLQNRISELEKLIDKTKPGNYVVRTFGAKVREKPSFNAKVVKYFTKGHRVAVAMCISNFCKIGENMWISKYIIKKVH